MYERHEYTNKVKVTSGNVLTENTVDGWVIAVYTVQQCVFR